MSEKTGKACEESRIGVLDWSGASRSRNRDADGGEWGNGGPGTAVRSDA